MISVLAVSNLVFRGDLPVTRRDQKGKSRKDQGMSSDTDLINLYSSRILALAADSQAELVVLPPGESEQQASPEACERAVLASWQDHQD